MSLHPATRPVAPDVVAAPLGQQRTVGWMLRLRWLLPIVAILLVASAFRLQHIEQPLTDVFSWRQSSTAMMAANYYRQNWNILYPEVSWDGPGPSYQGREFQTISYLTALLYLLFGQQEIVGRLVAVAFGVWGVFALYQLTRRVWGETHARAAALVAALLPGAIFIERSFLPDPAMVSLATTTVWLFVAYLQTSRRRFLVMTVLIGSWALASKLPGALIGLPMVYASVAILGWRHLLRPSRLVTLGLAALLLLLPVGAYYLWARELAARYPPYHFAGSANWVWVEGIGPWLERGYYLASFTENLSFWFWTSPVIALLALGLLVRPPDGAERGQSGEVASAPWLFHWWLAGCALYYLIGARELSENVWNLHIFNPPAAALAGRGLLLVGSIAGARLGSPLAVARLALVLAVVILAGQTALGTMYRPQHAEDGYRLGLALAEVSRPGDLIVTMTNDLGDPVAIYYSGRRGWVMPPASPDWAWNHLPTDDEISIRLFETLRERGATWLGIVRRFDKDSWSRHRKLLEHFNSTCEWWAEGDQWVIYRVLSPEELAARGIRRPGPLPPARD